MSFASLSNRAQMAALRPVALSALREFGVVPTRLRVINHAYNTTYSVETARGRFALRLNVNSHRTEEQLNAEVAWVSALASEFDVAGSPVHFPIPQSTRSGEKIVHLPCEAMGREVPAVLYSWLEGRSPGGKAYLPVAEAMGLALRLMHEQAEGFALPEGASLLPVSSSLFNRPYRLDELAPDLDHGMMRQVVQEADEILLRELAKPQRPIHYDLHAGNVKWGVGRLAVFDFDDCMMGRPLLDAAVSLFYLRGMGEEVERRFWRGFSGTKQAALERFEATEREFETLVASRQVGLSQEFFLMTTATWRDRAPRYAKVGEERIRRFMETGLFDPRVASL